jgi:hypothetical protein
LSKFLLGADPEIFLQDAAGDLVSAIDRIGGTKKEPKPLPIGDGFAVQEDNVAVEYNIPASGSKEAFTSNIQKAMEFLTAEVNLQGLRFATMSAAEFPYSQLMDPRALEFGCDPDFNAWLRGKPNPRPKAGSKQLRTCGGHVHVGHKFTTFNDLLEFVKYLDLYLGVPSTIQDEGEKRKELYGKAGAYRAKEYGVEYRSLSNYWVFDPKLTTWVWESVEQAMDAWQQRKVDLIDEGQHIVAAINENKKDVAYMLIDKYNLQLAA